MKEHYVKLKNAVKLGYWAYKNPQVIQKGNMQLIGSLFDLIGKTIKESKPYMTRLCLICPDDTTKDIASIWVGSGLTSDPIDRIRELNEENAKLRVIIDSKIQTAKDS